MATTIELYNFLNEIIPRSLICDWDNDGLMCCPEPTREAERILITLDISEDAVDYAETNKYDLIISHHPLIFKPLQNIAPDGNAARKIIKLIKAGIAAMSFHTRLDGASGGVNDILAAKLGLTGVKSFGPEREELGRIGTLKKPLSFADFAFFLKKALDIAHFSAVRGSSYIFKVATVGGAGKDFLEPARRLGADALVTGEVSYNAINEAPELGISVFAAGHYETERFICERIKDLVLSKFEIGYCEIFDSNNIISL